MASILFYQPNGVQQDGSMAAPNASGRGNKGGLNNNAAGRYQYSDAPLEAGLLTNDSGLSYMSVPLSSPTLDDDAHTGVGGHVAPNSSMGNGGSSSDKAKTPSSHPRLCSLDCFRGLTIAWMIMSDEAGDPWTHWIDHSPWNGIHFADFVFPAFVFIVGMAIPLSTHKFAMDRWGATRKAFVRAIKMFILGFISASGGFPVGPTKTGAFTAYQLDTIRVPGILQRIAFCYLVVVLIHIWVPVRASDPSPNRSAFYLYSKYAWQWLVTACFVAIYFALTFGTNVNDLPGQDCGYGKLDPNCNASGYWDRQIIGLQHMYTEPTYQRTPECSSNSPASSRLDNPAVWCHRPYDPEGILGSFTAVSTGFFGLFFGYVLANETRHRARIKQWLGVSAVCMTIGLILHFSGFLPINKNLWSFSYVLVMVGVDGVVFSAFYFCVDVKQWKKMWFPLMCMGMNAIGVFIFAQSDIGLDTYIQWFYVGTPNNSLYTWYRDTVLVGAFGSDWGRFLWAWTKICAWLGISTLLAKHKIFFKL